MAHAYNVIQTISFSIIVVIALLQEPLLYNKNALSAAIFMAKDAFHVINQLA
jgi:hypothetical protein